MQVGAGEPGQGLQGLGRGPASAAGWLRWVRPSWLRNWSSFAGGWWFWVLGGPSMRKALVAAFIEVDQDVLVVDVVGEFLPGPPVKPGGRILVFFLVPGPEVFPDLGDHLRAGGEERPVRRGVEQLAVRAEPGRSVPLRIDRELDELHLPRQVSGGYGSVHLGDIGRDHRADVLAQGEEVGEDHGLPPESSQAGGPAGVIGQRRVGDGRRDLRVQYRPDRRRGRAGRRRSLRCCLLVPHPASSAAAPATHATSAAPSSAPPPASRARRPVPVPTRDEVVWPCR